MEGVWHPRSYAARRAQLRSRRPAAYNALDVGSKINPNHPIMIRDVDGEEPRKALDQAEVA